MGELAQPLWEPLAPRLEQSRGEFAQPLGEPLAP